MMHSPSELYWVSWMVLELDSGTTSSLERCRAPQRGPVSFHTPRLAAQPEPEPSSPARQSGAPQTRSRAGRHSLRVQNLRRR